MMWNTGMGPAPWMWLVMGGATVAFWVAVAFAIRWAFGGQGVRVPVGSADRPSRTAAPDASGRRGPGPLDVLQGRLARGEIDVDEYARARRALLDDDPTMDRDHPTVSAW